MTSSGSDLCAPPPEVGLTDQIAAIVHDLCQPLTSLHCRLELARMVGTPEDHREAVELGVVECARMSRHVHALRELLGRLAPVASEEL